MKKLLSLLLCAALLLPLLGCHEEAEKPQQPVNFYYRRAETQFGSAQGVIAPQVSEGAGYADTAALLNAYLKGPSDPAFDNTFPASTKVLSLSVEDGTAYVRLNDSLSLFTGYRLTVACACITLTVLELTDAEAVCITAANEQLDGAASVTMDRASLLLLDLYENPDTEETR